ncbi:MAG: rhomboid family intramembrane serine protease [Paludibacteraceae bacterium]|nr:rhomboid family intramembrane serine protease [Paludibacteraceae bacterium]
MITTLIIIVTVFVSIAAFGDRTTVLPEKLRHGEWFRKLDFSPANVISRKQWYRLFSSGLLHVDWGHLLFNMLTLYFFGYLVEGAFNAIYGNGIGTVLYLVFYITALGASSVPDLVKHKNDPFYHAAGASGAISAVLFASILINPKIGIMIMFIPIPVPGYVFGVIYLAYSAYMAKRGGSNIGHLAHFAGAVYGIVFPLLFEPKLLGYFFEQMRM